MLESMTTTVEQLQIFRSVCIDQWQQDDNRHPIKFDRFLKDSSTANPLATSGFARAWSIVFVRGMHRSPLFLAAAISRFFATDHHAFGFSPRAALIGAEGDVAP